MSTSEERRDSSDRRNVEQGPPKGWRDRRHSVERRLSAAEEAQLSPEEFLKYFGAVTSRPDNGDHQVDHAAEVLDRAHDRL
ncbi:MAG: hypothetical protein ACM3X0_07425 [Bacteroidota bacterium]